MLGKLLVIDADSLIFQALHRHKDKNFEYVYAETMGQVYDIKKTISYKMGLKVQEIYEFIVLSPQVTFRNQLSPVYKAGRKPKDKRIIEVKEAIFSRLRDKTIVVPNVEADDIVIHFGNKKNAIIAAYEKDVINAAMCPVYNYRNRQVIEPKTELQVEEWYVYQSIMGDGTDGVAGIKGYGKKKTKDWLALFNNRPPWDRVCALFGSEEDALLAMRLVRMDQWSPEEGLKLWTPDKYPFK